MNTPISEKFTDRSAQLLVQALEKSWEKYLKELELCHTEFSDEAVHDLRVAARRIMAIMQLLHSVSPRPRFRKITRALKEQLDDFDDLRDTQVILAELSKSVPEFPELQGFQKQRQQREEKLLKSVQKKLKKFEPSDLERRIKKVRESLETESSADLESLALQAVDDAYSLALQRLGKVDVTRPPTIHRVRIAFKSFRYMVEIVHPLLPGYPQANLKSMHDYQSWMGEVQDAEVFLQSLTSYIKYDSSQDLEPASRYYEGRHTDAISAYADSMDLLHRFWRAAPDQPFPWEIRP